MRYDDIAQFASCYYERNYGSKIKQKELEFETLRKAYRNKEAEKVINELSKVDLSNFKNSTLNLKKLSSAIEVSYDAFEKESFYKELLDKCGSVSEERYFMMTKLQAQDRTSEFRNVEEIEKFIDDCMKGTYTEDLIKRLYE